MASTDCKNPYMDAFTYDSKFGGGFMNGYLLWLDVNGEAIIINLLDASMFITSQDGGYFEHKFINNESQLVVNNLYNT
jgi:hypothetical protein